MRWRLYDFYLERSSKSDENIIIKRYVGIYSQRYGTVYFG